MCAWHALRGPLLRLDSICAWREPSWFDLEAEAAFGAVRVDRQHLPEHLVAAGRQRVYPDDDLLRIGRVDAAGGDDRSGARAQLRGGELRLERLAKPHAHLARRALHGAAHRRARMIELGMRISDRGTKREGEQAAQKTDGTHGHLLAAAVLNSGAPIDFGKMSSR